MMNWFICRVQYVIHVVDVGSTRHVWKFLSSINQGTALDCVDHHAISASAP